MDELARPRARAAGVVTRLDEAVDRPRVTASERQPQPTTPPPTTRTSSSPPDRRRSRVALRAAGERVTVPSIGGSTAYSVRHDRHSTRLQTSPRRLLVGAGGSGFRAAQTAAGRAGRELRDAGRGGGDTGPHGRPGGAHGSPGPAPGLARRDDGPGRARPAQRRPLSRGVPSPTSRSAVNGAHPRGVPAQGPGHGVQLTETQHGQARRMIQSATTPHRRVAPWVGPRGAACGGLLAMASTTVRGGSAVGGGTARPPPPTS